MQADAWVAFQPGSDGRMLVAGVVVADNVQPDPCPTALASPPVRELTGESWRRTRTPDRLLIRSDQIVQRRIFAHEVSRAQSESRPDDQARCCHGCCQPF